MDRQSRTQMRQQLYKYIDDTLQPQYPTLFDVDGMEDVIYNTLVAIQMGRLQESYDEGQPLTLLDLCYGIKRTMLQYFCAFQAAVQDNDL